MGKGLRAEQKPFYPLPQQQPSPLWALIHPLKAAVEESKLNSSKNVSVYFGAQSCLLTGGGGGHPSTPECAKESAELPILWQEMLLQLRGGG